MRLPIGMEMDAREPLWLPSASRLCLAPGGWRVVCVVPHRSPELAIQSVINKHDRMESVPSADGLGGGAEWYLGLEDE